MQCTESAVSIFVHCTYDTPKCRKFSILSLFIGIKMKGFKEFILIINPEHEEF
jgi:hypothetical protein